MYVVRVLFMLTIMESDDFDDADDGINFDPVNSELAAIFYTGNLNSRL